jgi:hypothetical protein
MDEFSWGNTRVVIGEGKDKKVITNDDEKFDDSMIPVKKFSGTYIFYNWDMNFYSSRRQNMKRKLGKLEHGILTRRDMAANPAQDHIPDHVLLHHRPPITMHPMAAVVAITTATQI